MTSTSNIFLVALFPPVSEVRNYLHVCSSEIKQVIMWVEELKKKKKKSGYDMKITFLTLVGWWTKMKSKLKHHLQNAVLTA